MLVGRINSRAFQRAALGSESYRISGLLCLLAALMLYVIVSWLASGEFRLFLKQALILALAVVYELLMLVLVKRALLNGSAVPPAMWMLNVLVETQLPTLALLLLIEGQYMAPDRLLAAPAALLYFLFIILSALRLSPGLSLLTGVISALAYGGVAFYTEVRYAGPHTMSGALRGPFYFTYAGLILTGGAVAAFVAARIRVHVAAALREAELERQLGRVHRDLEIARSIQQGLLPTQAPTLPNFELAGWNQPADETGGDYFDWQALPDGRLAVSLGDATGHGIGPALVTASCRAYARASFLSDGTQDHVLDSLNRLLSEDLADNRFVTYAVVFLDTSRSHIRVLSAGHGPILWYRYTTDSIENIEALGTPLGMLSDAEYGRAIEHRLDSGDMLVMVTDGFYEWENPEGEEFGLKRLEAVIRESRDCAANEVISRLRTAVMIFCRGTEQKDDLTAVILKRKKTLV